MNTIFLMLLSLCIGCIVMGFCMAFSDYASTLLIYFDSKKSDRRGKIDFSTFKQVFTPETYLVESNFPNSLFLKPEMIFVTMDTLISTLFRFHVGIPVIDGKYYWLGPIDYFRAKRYVSTFDVVDSEENRKLTIFYMVKCDCPEMRFDDVVSILDGMRLSSEEVSETYKQ